MVVINTFKSEEEFLAPFKYLLASMQPTITAFRSISFSHTHRIGNIVTHNLTKHAKYVKGLSMWIDDVPSHLYNVLKTNYD